MKHKETIMFGVYNIGALALYFTPIIHVPFGWLETYFHEVSHGIMALLTGGSVTKIEVYISGGGKCFTMGGWSALIAFSGYFGAVLWGVALFFGARSHSKSSNILAYVLSIAVILTLVFWARDFFTILILLIIASLVFISNKYVFGDIFPRIMEFIGVYILVSALFSPLHLIDGRHRGDGATLAEITYLPEFFWILVWLSFGVFALYRSWRYLHEKAIASEVDSLLNKPSM